MKRLPEILQTGPPSRIQIPYEIQFVKSKLNLCSNKTLTKVNWATVSTTRYVRGTVLLYSTDPNESLPLFVTLSNIFLFDSKQLILMGNLLKTVNFNSHYFAYEAQDLEKRVEVALFHDNLISGIPCNENVMKSGKKFITLRCYL